MYRDDFALYSRCGIEPSSASSQKVFRCSSARFAEFIGVDFETAKTYLLSFSMLAFATFIYDTLDVCMRLGRYVLQEFSGWQSTTGRYVCTGLTLIPPLYLVLQNMTHPDTGLPVPAWKVFWTLFGTANQMLAALSLLGVTVWLLRTGKTWWYTAIPAGFMILVTITSLILFLVKWLRHCQESVIRSQWPVEHSAAGAGGDVVVKLRTDHSTEPANASHGGHMTGGS